MAKGYKAAQTFHEENTGLGYTPFTLKKDGDQAVVRILQSQDDWVNLYIHTAFKKIKGPTRCAAQWVDRDGQQVEDKSTCPLCLDDIRRTMRTYIPVRVRGDSNEKRVQILNYGREGLQELISQIEELKEDQDITYFDFKVKRKGNDLDTKYFWVKDYETKRPLSEDERALEVPDMEVVMPVLDEHELIFRAKQVSDAENAAAVDPSSSNGNGNGNGKKLPF
jgi:hypothetical protein